MPCTNFLPQSDHKCIHDCRTHKWCSIIQFVLYCRTTIPNNCKVIIYNHCFSFICANIFGSLVRSSLPLPAANCSRSPRLVHHFISTTIVTCELQRRCCVVCANVHCRLQLPHDVQGYSSDSFRHLPRVSWSTVCSYVLPSRVFRRSLLGWLEKIFLKGEPHTDWQCGSKWLPNWKASFHCLLSVSSP